METGKLSPVSSGRSEATEDKINPKAAPRLKSRFSWVGLVYTRPKRSQSKVPFATEAQRRLF